MSFIFSFTPSLSRDTHLPHLSIKPYTSNGGVKSTSWGQAVSKTTNPITTQEGGFAERGGEVYFLI